MTWPAREFGVGIPTLTLTQVEARMRDRLMPLINEKPARAVGRRPKLSQLAEGQNYRSWPKVKIIAVGRRSKLSQLAEGQNYRSWPKAKIIVAWGIAPERNSLYRFPMAEGHIYRRRYGMGEVSMAFGHNRIGLVQNSWGDAPGYGEIGLRPKRSGKLFFIRPKYVQQRF